MSLIEPVGQWKSDYTLTTMVTWNHLKARTSAINIATRANDSCEVLLDGGSIAENWTDIGNTGFRSVIVIITQGVHRLTSDCEETFTVLYYDQAFQEAFAIRVAETVFANECWSSTMQPPDTTIIDTTTVQTTTTQSTTTTVDTTTQEPTTTQPTTTTVDTTTQETTSTQPTTTTVDTTTKQTTTTQPTTTTVYTTTQPPTTTTTTLLATTDTTTIQPQTTTMTTQTTIPTTSTTTSTTTSATTSSTATPSTATTRAATTSTTLAPTTTLLSHVTLETVCLPGRWLNWGPWGWCSDFCTVQTRSRECTYGLPCEGNTKDHKDCEPLFCNNTNTGTLDFSYEKRFCICAL